MLYSSQAIEIQVESIDFILANQNLIFKIKNFVHF